MKNFLIGIVFILVACNGQKKASVKDSIGLTASDSPLVLLLQDEYSGFDVEETMVIKDQKRLESFYSKINRTRKPGLPLPTIDFSKEMVIVQCSGEQTYSAIPTLALSKETDLEIVLASKIEKETKNSSNTVRTNPFCVYKIPLTTKEIVVEKGAK